MRKRDRNPHQNRHTAYILTPDSFALASSSAVGLRSYLQSRCSDSQGGRGRRAGERPPTASTTEHHTNCPGCVPEGPTGLQRVRDCRKQQWGGYARANRGSGGRHGPSDMGTETALSPRAPESFQAQGRPVVPPLFTPALVLFQMFLRALPRLAPALAAAVRPRIVSTVVRPALLAARPYSTHAPQVGGRGCLDFAPQDSRPGLCGCGGAPALAGPLSPCPVAFPLQAIAYPAPRVHVRGPAADFNTGAVIDGEITSLKLSEYKGKWVVLFFYPKVSVWTAARPPGAVCRTPMPQLIIWHRSLGCWPPGRFLRDACAISREWGSVCVVVWSLHRCVAVAAAVLVL